mmetsp:Transcript_1275/g.3132  ORF Transcript_1275/g.3132 Transcript_1275/m.3132 type:complete len:238 (+) Transcript_1275:180-893(+)|eukprot:CAMPEP_0171487392 /NCGR_PEP_ID=MMETSP0958-20121227/1622_1 /TAXON_ID=87120 /ORGANISM="Aurantiochytrium limacinum, Strain ATCCMYA-1381" /LENGTH=237 /DNA_ID=CAMNT_0012020381 /DNA_START=117 /DNA_END=830 /DNA_ORIENTATION=+
MNFLLGLLFVVVPGGLGLYLAKHGHSRFITDIFVGIIITVLGSSFLVFELINLMIWPFRLVRRVLGLAPKPLPAAEASDLATGRKTTEKRKIVLFDGVCVLCNRFGRFVVSHLPDPNEVAFVPFQDPMANPHVNVKRLTEEFGFEDKELEDRIAVIEGDKIFWGPDAVITIMQWCYLPFPLAKLGLLVPFPIRDAAYLTVAKNRYRWFGTQPLDQNFAKYLCPYLYVKKAFGSGKQD